MAFLISPMEDCDWDRDYYWDYGISINKVFFRGDYYLISWEHSRVSFFRFLRISFKSYCDPYFCKADMYWSISYHFSLDLALIKFLLELELDLILSLFEVDWYLGVEFEFFEL